MFDTTQEPLPLNDKQIAYKKRYDEILAEVNKIETYEGMLADLNTRLKASDTPFETSVLRCLHDELLDFMAEQH